MSELRPQWIEPDWPAPPTVRALSTLRFGGVSGGPYASLNLGGRAGDDPSSVAENRRRLGAAAGIPGEPSWLAQVHGARVLDLDSAKPGDGDAASVGASADSGAAGAGAVGADASVTRRAGVVCAILTADCMPILLTSDAGDVVAAAHAGWRGIAGGVIEATVAAAVALTAAGAIGAAAAGRVAAGGAAAGGAAAGGAAAGGAAVGAGATAGAAMGAGAVVDARAGAGAAGARATGATVAATGRADGRAAAGSLMAWLGPAIGPRHFEVGPEVLEAMREGDPGAAAAFSPNARGRLMADLEQLARRRLRALGVHRIYGGGQCTFDDAARYFSHRRDGGTTGRHATLIWLTAAPGAGCKLPERAKSR